MDVHKQLLVAWPAESMFDLIEAAEQYPSFLPWCAGAQVLSRDDEHVAATIRVNYHGVRFEFTTRNPKRRPEWLGVTLASGPFRRFEGEWRLRPLAGSGCHIDFRLSYDFASTLMSKVASAVFERIADTLVDALAAHADNVLVPAPAVPAPAALAVPPQSQPSAPDSPEGATHAR